jgi:Lon protease-like protein
VAEILKFQPLPDGRSLILCKGRERFRVEDGIESGMPYYEALAGPYEDEPNVVEQGPDIEARRQVSVDLFHRVLREVVRYQESFPEIDLDDEAGFQIAQAIRIDAAWQQTLLESRTERERLDLLDDLLRAVLEANEEDAQEREGGFGGSFEIE